MFAPVYRQITLAGLLGAVKVTAADRARAYQDVRDAWRDYLRNYNHGRGVVLIGHSQGSFVLRELVAKEIDPKPKVRKRLISAVLLGGNVTVKKGKDVGGDFKHVRACRSRSQTGCVVAFSTYGEPPPGERDLRPHEGARARGAVHQPGGARRRLGEDHADPADASRSRPAARSRRRSASLGVPEPDVSTAWGEMPERLPRAVLERQRRRAPDQPATRRAGLHPVARPQLGPASRRREHRARQPARPRRATRPPSGAALTSAHRCMTA